MSMERNDKELSHVSRDSSGGERVTSKDPWCMPQKPTETKETASMIRRLTSQNNAQPKQPRRIGESYAPATLALHNIKVRDFAYESTLPPLPSITFPVRPVHMGPRPLKRARKEYDDEPLWARIAPNDYRAFQSKRAKQLVRVPTEPVIDDENSQPRREHAYADLSDYSSQEPESQSQDAGGGSSHRPKPLQGEPTLPVFPVRMPEEQDFNRERTPSGDTEPYVDTPIVTPNGSLQFKDVASTTDPASSLNTATPAQALVDVLTESSRPASEVTGVQNGFRPSSPSALPPGSTPVHSSGLSSGDESDSGSPPRNKSRRVRIIKSDSPQPPKNETNGAEPPRYFLRERRVSRPPPAKSSSARSRSRSRRNASPSRRQAVKPAAPKSLKRERRGASRVRNSDDNTTSASS